MPVPAFGFSFGDFVTAISLLNDIRKAWQETDGAKSEIRAVVTDLNQLESLLKHLSDDGWEKGGDLTHINGVRGVALSTQSTLEVFWTKVKAYNEICSKLQQGIKRFQDDLRKSQWAAGMKEEVSKCRATIIFKVVTITSLLIVSVHFTSY